MKCPNCGGNVSVNDLKCPYCGTPNPEGIAFQKEIHKRRRFNEYLREKTREQMRLPLAHRILNLSVCVLLVLAFLLLLVDLGLFLFLEDAFASFRRPKDYEQQMAQMYEDGLYGELNAFMDQYELEPEDYPVYTQMTILQYTYADFVRHSMNCTEALSRGRIPNDFYLEYAIDSAQELLCPDIPAFPDIYSENQEILDGWQEEAVIYLTGPLAFSPEEIALLYPEDEYDFFSYKELEALMAAVKERWKEAGYLEEDN